MPFTKNVQLVRQVAANFNIRRQCAGVYQRAGCTHLSRAIARKSSAHDSLSPSLADSCGPPKSIVKTTIHEELLEILEAQTFYLYDPASMDVFSRRLNKYSEKLSGCMEIDDGKDICFLSLPEGSLNHQENLLKEYTHYSELRRITIEFKEGIEPQQVLLQAYPLGRIRITTQEPKVRTQWVVFFDSQKICGLWRQTISIRQRMTLRILMSIFRRVMMNMTSARISLVMIFGLLSSVLFPN
ncbi:hypothetical protein B0O99DRAFT_331593 [Bisporella sp. PMI_857]|nr:hypothetical protein B0O99DRAFT_331593 [Bisporella sp. PMI_857]